MSALAPVAPVAAATVVVGAIVLLARFEISNQVVALLRVLVPSWRFFDGIGVHPDLLARVAGPDGRFGPWLALLPPPPRAWWNVFWHPDGNLSMACHSLLDRLQADLAAAEEDDDPAQLVSYRLVLDLVMWCTRDHAAAALVQFRLAGPSPRPGASPCDLIVSSVHVRSPEQMAER